MSFDNRRKTCCEVRLDVEEGNGLQRSRFKTRKEVGRSVRGEPIVGIVMNDVYSPRRREVSEFGGTRDIELRELLSEVGVRRRGD